jgi:hypothetical protein
MRRISLAIFVLALASGIAGALAGCGSDETASSETTTETTTPTTTNTTTHAETESTSVEETTGATTGAAAPTTVTIVVRDGRVVGGIARPVVDKGDRVVIVVRTDAGEYVHLHGYDVEKQVVPGRAVRIPFTADVAGRFELELHNPSVVLAEIEVRP